eukprot:2637072-Prorocentrum_lima.AAC.1
MMKVMQRRRKPCFFRRVGLTTSGAAALERRESSEETRRDVQRWRTCAPTRRRQCDVHGLRVLGARLVPAPRALEQPSERPGLQAAGHEHGRPDADAEEPVPVRALCVQLPRQPVQGVCFQEAPDAPLRRGLLGEREEVVHEVGPRGQSVALPDVADSLGGD